MNQANFLLGSVQLHFEPDIIEGSLGSKSHLPIKGHGQEISQRVHAHSTDMLVRLALRLYRSTRGVMMNREMGVWVIDVDPHGGHHRSYGEREWRHPIMPTVGFRCRDGAGKPL